MRWTETPAGWDLELDHVCGPLLMRWHTGEGESVVVWIDESGDHVLGVVVAGQA